MLNRNEILKKAYIECMTEMYKRAQPSADFSQLIEDVNSGKIPKDTAIYERYYLSHEEFKYILNKYIEAYDIKSSWFPHIELVEQYLIEGGTKDKYIEPYVDENGHYHSGCRGYESVLPIKKQINDILNEQLEPGHRTKILTDKITEAVMNTITNCKEYYHFDREESSFSASISLGASPTSNKDTVIEYWKSQGINIDIEDRNPLLFWEQDYYGDDFEEVMIDEYGVDWKEQFDKNWEESKNSK